MNKALWMVLSGVLGVGISFNVAAMTQSELADVMARSAETKVSKAEQLNQDFERIVKQRTAEGKSVKVNGLGTFSRGESTTTQMQNIRAGQQNKDGSIQPATVSVTKWRKIKSTGSVSHGALLKELTATGHYTKEEASRLLDARISETKISAVKGGTITDNGGLGSFSTEQRAARSGKTPTGQAYTTKATYVPKFNPSSAAPGLKFTAAAAYKSAAAMRR